MKMQFILLVIVPFMCFLSAIVTGIVLEMLQAGIILTICAAMIPLIGSSILETKEKFEQKKSA